MPVIEERKSTIHVTEQQLRMGPKYGIAEAVHNVLRGLGVNVKVDVDDGQWYVDVSYYYAPTRTTHFETDINTMLNDNSSQRSARLWLEHKFITPYTDFSFELNWCQKRTTLDEMRSACREAQADWESGKWPGTKGPTGPEYFHPRIFDDPEEIRRKFPHYWKSYDAQPDDDELKQAHDRYWEQYY